MNGISERAICTITDDIRTLLIDSGLPKNFWAEAVAYSVYTRNLIPLSALPGKIPLEGWTKKKINISHLRTFGCKVHVKVPVDTNGRQVNGGSKLDERTLEGTFIGYLQGHRGYRVLLKDGRVVKSKDVEFMEGPAHRTEAINEVDGVDDALHSIQIPTAATKQVTPIPSPTIQPPLTTTTANDDPNENVRLASELPAITDYWKPTNPKRIPRPTEKVKAAFAAVSPSMEDFVELNRNLDNVIMGMVTGFKDLKAPRNQKEAYRLDKTRWFAAEVNELKMLEERETWELVPRPSDKNIVGSRFTYAVKTTGDGQWFKDKARFITQGNTMIEGEDFSETWAAVARLESIRMTAAFIAAYGLTPWQIDFTSAYLNTEIREEVYIKQPPGHEIDGKEDWVCRLKKAIYRMKQGGHQWYEELKQGYDGIGYYTSKADPCMRTKWTEDSNVTITNTYTDDVFGASSNKELAALAKDEITRCYEIKDVGEINKLLGIQVVWDELSGEISFSQEHYILDFLTEFNLSEITPRNTPEIIGQELSTDMSPTSEYEVYEMRDKPYVNLLGKVMYAQVGTRFDISNAVKNLSRFQKNPGLIHWRALLHLLGYLKSTAHFKLTYRPPPRGISPAEWVKPTGYVDADYAACKDTRKSTSGFVFIMAGSPVSWSSKRQATVALSTTEAEYIALSRAAQQAHWMHSWCDKIGFPQSEPAALRGDNLGSIHLTKNTKDHHKIKHIDIHHHYLRELATEGKIEVMPIRGVENLADIFTKPLPKETFRKHLVTLGIDTH